MASRTLFSVLAALVVMGSAIVDRQHEKSGQMLLAQDFRSSKEVDTSVQGSTFAGSDLWINWHKKENKQIGFGILGVLAVGGAIAGCVSLRAQGQNGDDAAKSADDAEQAAAENEAK
eukprot:TRINITY_DN105583_c0_g1_i1.p1 TRINITY_DN105583_c0_g1~~TRINITY_DN105583_c0_g1_i1.p1  ORF type:complete len:117 (-),score=28.60 TRINITY_DN105583_c0_g1_i1:50-400(-)